MDIARRVVEHLQGAHAELHRAVEALHAGGPEPADPVAKRRIAHLMSALFFGVLQPLYAEHPALAPPGAQEIAPLSADLLRAIFAEPV